MFEESFSAPGFVELNVFVVSVMVGFVVHAWRKQRRVSWLSFLGCYFLLLELCGMIGLISRNTTLVYVEPHHHHHPGEFIQ